VDRFKVTAALAAGGKILMMTFNGVLGAKPPRVLSLPERGTPAMFQIDPKDSNICEGSLLFFFHPPAAMSLAIEARVLERNEPGSERRGKGRLRSFSAFSPVTRALFTLSSLLCWPAPTRCRMCSRKQTWLCLQRQPNTMFSGLSSPGPYDLPGFKQWRGAKVSRGIGWSSTKDFLRLSRIG
jgi:hypothetical protein